MLPLAITAYRLAKDIGVAPIAVSQILRGKRGLSPSMMLRLGAYFGVSPLFWCQIQAAYDLRQAEIEGDAEHIRLCSQLEKLRAVVRRLPEEADGTQIAWSVKFEEYRDRTSEKPGSNHKRSRSNRHARAELKGADDPGGIPTKSKPPKSLNNRRGTNKNGVAPLNSLAKNGRNGG